MNRNFERPTGGPVAHAYLRLSGHQDHIGPILSRLETQLGKFQDRELSHRPVASDCIDWPSIGRWSQLLAKLFGIEAAGAQSVSRMDGGRPSNPFGRNGPRFHLLLWPRISALQG